MSTSRTWSVALTGMEGHLVEVEADVTNHTPEFRIIGLPDKSLGEAAQRVRNAVVNAGLDLPRRKLTVNLSPASLPKHGSSFDLAIAVAALAAGDEIPLPSIRQTVHLGELGLDGRVRPVPGVLPAAYAAAQAGFDRVVVPEANAQEARLVPGIEVTAVASLAEAAAAHGAEIEVPDVEPIRLPARVPTVEEQLDLADVVGQEEAVDAVIVAAAGGHHMMLSGPPGAGKTMLARRLPGILPALTDEESLDVAAVRSLNGENVVALDRTPPFESPHHSASAASLIGGGSRAVRPGAIVRAHNGVLLLDEAPEFPRAVLDSLRQPLESGRIEVHRAGFTAQFPARFQLVLAMNPCPCGNYGVRGGDCLCPPIAIRRYEGKLSGPLRDRIDIEMHVSRVTSARTRSAADSPITTALARERVQQARDIAAERWAGTPWRRNAEVPGERLRGGSLRLPPAVRKPLDRALERGGLTLRGYDRTLRLAWTAADLAGRTSPGTDEIGRALFLKRGLAA